MLLQNVRYALRALRKNPGSTVVAAITLALGIGALTAIFSVVNAVVVRPLPYQDPDQLVMVWERNDPKGVEKSDVAPGALGDWQKQNVTFEGLAGFWANTVTIRDREDTPLKGAPGSVVSVIISDGLWRRTFGADPTIVGQSINVEEQPVVVIGVMPPQFAFPQDAELCTNVNFPLQGRFGRWMNAIGRMEPDVGIEAAAGDLRAIAGRMAEAYPSSNAGWSVTFAGLHEDGGGDTAPALLVLLGATAAVLLIDCANWARAAV